MERFILPIITILFTLSLNALAINQSPLLIKVKRAVVYGQDVTGEFSGDLESFIDSEYFGAEYSYGELEFTLTEKRAYFSDARKIARYAWKYITENATVKSPYPCGFYYRGDITEKYKKNENRTIIQYHIKGSGDGSVDSCTGNGGPGWWSYEMIVDYDPATMSGSISYQLQEE